MTKKVHTKAQDKKALAWIKKEFGKDSLQTKKAIKIGSANWVLKEYGLRSWQYDKHVLESKPKRAKLNEGLHSNRLAVSRHAQEKRIVKEWKKINKNNELLGYLLSPNQKVEVNGRGNPIVNKHDNLIASTIIQWLGTEVGESFLESVGYVKDGSEKDVKIIKKKVKQLLDYHIKYVTEQTSKLHDMSANIFSNAEDLYYEIPEVLRYDK